MKKILFLSSSIQFYENFLYKTIQELNNQFDIFICTNLSLQTLEFPDVSLIDLNISRKISPFQDFLCALKLFQIICRVKPDVIISSSPKGSLIVAMTNLFYRCRRFHLLTGIIWSGKMNRLKKFLYKSLDYFFLFSCEKIFADSPSQIQFLHKENFFINKLSLIDEGSIQGVDLDRFKINDHKQELRKKLGFSHHQTLLLFLGRISPEKGIHYFVNLIKNLRKKHDTVMGLIVGRDEKNIISNYQKNYSDFNENFLYFPYTNKPEEYIQSCDIMIIPSEREGFCQAAIEASACGVPIVGFDVIGLKDSIIDNISGYLIPFADKKNMEVKTNFLINNHQIRVEMGAQGRSRVMERFNQTKVVSHFVKQLSSAIMR